MESDYSDTGGAHFVVNSKLHPGPDLCFSCCHVVLDRVRHKTNLWASSTKRQGLIDSVEFHGPVSLVIELPWNAYVATCNASDRDIVFDNNAFGLVLQPFNTYYWATRECSLHKDLRHYRFIEWNNLIHPRDGDDPWRLHYIIAHIHSHYLRKSCSRLIPCDISASRRCHSWCLCRLWCHRIPVGRDAIQRRDRQHPPINVLDGAWLYIIVISPVSKRSSNIHAVHRVINNVGS